MASNYKIGDICSLVRGSFPIMKTVPGEYPLVVTAAFRRSASTYQLEGPAVCVPLISSTGHGDAALHRVHYQEGKFALANLLVALIPKNKEICNPKYLYYLLMAKKDEYFVPLMLGTANVSLKERDIASVEVSLPPLDEQRRIVSRIENLELKITQAHSLRQLAAEECRAFIPAAIREIQLRSSTGITQMPLLTLIRMERRPVAIQIDKEYREIGIYSYGRGVFHKAPRTGSEIGDKKLFWIKDGDLILQITFAWEGAVALAGSSEEGMCGSVRFPTFRVDENLCDHRFLVEYLKTREGVEQLGKISPGSAGRNRVLALDRLDEVMIPVPTLAAQRRVMDALHLRVPALARLQFETAGELDALMPSILAKAFRGEL